MRVFGFAGWLGATVFRTHDVRATRRAVDMVATVRGDRAPLLAVRGVPRDPAKVARSDPPQGERLC